MGFDRSLLDTYTEQARPALHGLDLVWSATRRVLPITLAVLTLAMIALALASTLASALAPAPAPAPARRFVARKSRLRRDFRATEPVVVAAMVATLLAWHLDGVESLRHANTPFQIWLVAVCLTISTARRSPERAERTS
ncbi:MAG: hypothetical protein R2698_07930 [Microthrixaceae bacterium]